MRILKNILSSKRPLFRRGAALMRRCSWKAAVVLGTAGSCMAASASGNAFAASVTAVQHYVTTERVRVVVRLNSAVDYTEGTATDPYRIFFDLQGARPADGLVSTTVVGDPYVHRIRIGEHAPGITRLVLDLDRPATYTASFEDNPPRLVIEVSRRATVLQAGLTVPPSSAGSSRTLSPHDTKIVNRRQETPSRKNSRGENARNPAPASVPEQAPPSSPEVTYANGMLTIVAQNSTLGEVLQAVAARTGSTLDAPPDLISERVAARLGPGTPREVLSGLLSGPGLGYILLGDDGRPEEVRGIILTASATPDEVPSSLETAPPNSAVAASAAPALQMTDQQMEEAASQNPSHIETLPATEAAPAPMAANVAPAGAPQQPAAGTQEQKLLQDLLRTMRQKDEHSN